MPIDFKSLFNKALRDENKILRPYLYPAEGAPVSELAIEDTYLRLRLARMFLKDRRVLFQTKYPVFHVNARFAGLDGPVETNFVVRPELAGDDDKSRLDDVVTLDQTVLGPVLYRGGDLGLVLGLYSAPADDWAKRFIQLAEGVSKLTLNAGLTTAISVANTIKTSVESMVSSDGMDLKLGLDKELKQGEWLVPGYLVMVAAPDEQVPHGELTFDGELRNADGSVYSNHDYIVLAIEVSDHRSDWQGLGYGRLWQEMLKTAGDAQDIQAVKDAYLTFSGAIMASADLSWSDRSAILKMAQQRIKAIREARQATDFFDSLEGAKGLEAMLEMEKLFAVPELSPEAKTAESSPSELLQTDWID